MKENSSPMNPEAEGSEIFNIRLSPKVRQALWTLSEESDENRSTVIRRLVLGAKIHPRLTDLEVEGLKAIIHVERDLKLFANHLNGFAKNMTEAERNKFLFNNRTIEGWAKAIGEAIEHLEEYKKKLTD